MAAFGSFLKTVDLATRIAIIIERHTNNYYVGWSAERLAEVVVEVRPTRPIHVDDATVISSNERLLNKKLAWVWVAETASARALRADVHAGRLTTMTAVKVAAARSRYTISPIFRTHGTHSIAPSLHRHRVFYHRIVTSQHSIVPSLRRHRVFEHRIVTSLHRFIAIGPCT